MTYYKFASVLFLLLNTQLTVVDANDVKSTKIRRSLKESASAKKGKKGKKGKHSGSYEVWASDQSNSISDQDSTGVNGSFLWIWDSESIGSQLLGQDGSQDAAPLPCTPEALVGPCDLWDVFPSTLYEVEDGGETGLTLGELPKFGRLHGLIKDPQARYFTANMYAPGTFRTFRFLLYCKKFFHNLTLVAYLL